MIKKLRLIGSFVLALMLFHTVGAPITSAAMVESESIVVEMQVDDARAKLSSAMMRSEVQEALQANGIDPQEALARVNSLSNAEVMAMSDKIDQLPAGGSAIIGAAVLIFLVLLVTDILGHTDVFPFVE